MADQQIDELSLKVEVKQKNVANDIKGISAAIDKLAVSLRKLGRVSAVMDKLSNLKLPSGFSKVTEKLTNKPPEYRAETVTDKKSFKYGEKVSGFVGADVAKNLSTSWGTIQTKQAVEAQEAAKAFISTIRETGTLVSTVTTKMADGTDKVIEKFEVLNDGIKTTYTLTNGVITQTKEQTNKQKDLATNIDKTAEAQKKLNKEQGKSSESTKKSASAWSKLTKAIGRIALYRTIRTAIKNIAQTWTEGLQNFAQYNEETNKAMSDVKNSFTQVKNTLGVTAGYLMQTLAPIITSLADSVVGLLDNINMALAKFQGKDYFSKAKKGADDYAASLKKAKGQLASFDTFTTLGGGGNEESSPEDMFAEASVAEGWNDSAETFLSIIELVKTVFDSVKQIIDALKPFLSSLIGIINHLIQKITPLITDLLTALVPVIIELVELLVPILVDLLETILPIIIDYFAALIKIIMEAVKILAPVIKMLINILKPLFTILSGHVLMVLESALVLLDIITPFLEIICEFLEPFAKTLEDIFNIIKKFFGGISNGIKGFFGGIKSIFGFAGGGAYETGDFFKANENGTTELIASTNTGGSVMNIDQWASISYSSFYRALSDYDAAQNGGQGSLDINTLGRGIAASSGFINEMNRRNASLKLR